jgi:hypothetical protein
MQINWCLKGIQQQPSFGDVEALAVLTDTGILSGWMLSYANTAGGLANVISQNALSLPALDNHVNHYGTVGPQTPYISLSAGCREYAGTASPGHYPAYRSALEFATHWGTTTGYIFRCWVVTSPQIAAELPGLADEVRDLNLFANFYRFHHEGEVAAKLVVPRRQIQWVQKVDNSLRPAIWLDGHGPAARRNVEFSNPRHISNLVPELS